MQHNEEQARYYRALSAQMRARAYAEHDAERRAMFLQLAASYVEVAEAWERITPPSGGADSTR